MTEQSARRLRVAVLMGGISSERAVSLSTGKQIVSALNPSRYEVFAIDTQDPSALISAARPQLPGSGPSIAPAAGEAIAPAAKPALPTAPVDGPHQKPDVVVIALHGRGGEDGALQGMLEVLGVPYTGSGILASALAMDKAMAKRLMCGAGIPVIPEILVRRGHAPDDHTLIRQVEAALNGFPVFVKPNAEGSTVGGALVNRPEQLAPAVAEALRHDNLALIETYVRGMEITVGVLGNTGGDLEVLPVVEIVPKGEFYDYESKYSEGGSEHVIPARLPESVAAAARKIALDCHALLGCRGMSRTDLIATGDRLFVLEVNTIPGMTPTSLLPQAAAHAGLSFPALLDRLIGYALEQE